MDRYVHEKVHSADWGVDRFYGDGERIPYLLLEEEWHCQYCGSLHPKDALRRLESPQCQASGTDWKGWPHKFYITVENKFGKFYSKHLYDADEETLKKLVKLLDDKLGILFEIDENNDLKWGAPYKGYQTSTDKALLGSHMYSSLAHYQWKSWGTND